VVFSGGGARGAYEAGVIRYLVDELPRRLGRQPPFDILCGTSVGAVHACFIAGTADAEPRSGRGDRLVDFWRRMQAQEILPFTTRDLLGLPRRLLGLRGLAEALRGGRAPDRLYGLLDTSALEKLVLAGVPWAAIHRNVREGRVGAVCVAATEVATGRVVVFMDKTERELTGWSRDPLLVPRLTRLRATHALASAAIPLLFPLVRIASTYYADGGLRLNTPLSPAVRLGADRVLVVALRPAPGSSHATAEHRAEDYASPAFLFGKILNALLLDHLDTDLARMRDMNELIREGERVFGEDFLARLDASAGVEHEHPRRVIEQLVIRPSADLGMLAAQVLQNLPEAALRSPFVRFAMRNLGRGRRSAEADLASYLLFDGEYAVPLAELGYRDALAREDELVAFFTD
jgi:NTE family protein